MIVNIGSTGASIIFIKLLTDLSSQTRLDLSGQTLPDLSGKILNNLSGKILNNLSGKILNNLSHIPEQQIDSVPIVSAILDSIINIPEAKDSTTNVPEVPDQRINEIFYSFVILLFIVIFANNILSLVRRLCRKKSKFYNTIFVENIIRTIDKLIKSATYETDQDHGSDEKIKAMSSFIWVYDNITDNIVNTMIRSIHSLSFCLYIMYYDSHLIPILIVVYIVLGKYVIPYINEQSEKTNGMEESEKLTIKSEENDDIKTKELITKKVVNVETLRETAHCDYITEDIIKLNPNLVTLYESNLATNIRPDSVLCYIDIIKYYADNMSRWFDSHDMVNVIQNMIIFIIICLLFVTKQYSVIVSVLLNKDSMFSLIHTYSSMQQLEKNAELSMKGIVEILQAIDDKEKELLAAGIKRPEPINIPTTGSERNKIESLVIHGLQINIPAQKKNIPVNQSNEEFCMTIDKKQSLFQSLSQSLSQSQSLSLSVADDRYIYLEYVHIALRTGKVLVVDGPTGCGKTLLLRTMAGFNTNKMCKTMRINFDGGKSCDGQFNQILGSRYYVGQTILEQFKYNGKLAHPLFKLFPGAKSIDSVTRFLIEGFVMNPCNIPDELTESPHSKLSGGELQRYVLASQIWSAIQIKSDFIILDEVDRALDKGTAIRVIEWIVNNVPSFFVIVSHLTEVKDMLLEKNYISQIWTYDSSDKYQIKIVPELIE
jgi:energy-coupling factor transporter ATP-binding protein EcfA2